MNIKSLDNVAQKYFSTLNPIAEKISTDIAATKEAYEDLWNTLSHKEQNKIIDETIIYPEVVLKYSFSAQYDKNVEYFYSSFLHLGEKFGELSWNDEHSAPFSWMTHSQLDLKVFCDHEAVYPCDELPNSVPDDQKAMKVLSSKDSFIDPPGIVLGGSTSKFANLTAFQNKYTLKSSNNEERTLLEKLKCTAAVLKNQTIKSALNKAGIERTQRNSTGVKNDILLKPRNKCTVVPNSKILRPGAAKSIISKPKSPPPPPPGKCKCSSPENSQNYSETKALLYETLHDSFTNISSKHDVMSNKVEKFETQIDSTSQSADTLVPKTGFDFLDNW